MTPEDLKSCVVTKEYFKFRELLSSRNEPVRHLLCGSFFEIPLLYFCSNPTDIDVMFCDTPLFAAYDNVDTGVLQAKRERNALIIDTADCHIGFVRLKDGVEHFRKPYYFGQGPTSVSRLPVPDYLQKLLGSIFSRWRDFSLLTHDIVYAISCPQWPPEAQGWIARERHNGWPTESIIEAIVRNGCHLVSKPHGRNPNDDTQWRYSFSLAETILIHGCWTDVQKYIYHLLRTIKRDVVSKCMSDTKAFMSNYYIKTLMLWACEEKPSEFWQEQNIATSVRELLRNFSEKITARNIPHYFIPANNLMDDCSCSVDVDKETRLLMSYEEEVISEIMNKEPKAYQMNPSFIEIRVPNQSLYPLVAKLSNILYVSSNKIVDQKLQKSRILSICSSNYFYPEFKYLHEGIMTHLELLESRKCQNEAQIRECTTSAEGLFNQSIQKVDTGSTRIRSELRWSIADIYQQLWLFCGGEHVDNRSLGLYSGSHVDKISSACCHVELSDGVDSLSNQFRLLRLLQNPLEALIQMVVSNEMTIPFNVTYFVCSAYRANFVCNALSNYSQARDLCVEANKNLRGLSTLKSHMFPELLPFPLKNEWSGLYDENIQTVLGFLNLRRRLTSSSRQTSGRLLPVYICSVQYLRYIYTMCCRILNERVEEFGFDCEKRCEDRINTLRFQVGFSEAFLQTALYIGRR